MQQIFRVIDTETADFDSGVCEIASVDVVDGKICNPMSDLVNPCKPISFGAMAIHHIQQHEVENMPPIEEVIDKYRGATFLVAHNADFDKKMLPMLNEPWLCTLKLAKRIYDTPKHSNQYLRYALDLQPELPEGLYPHRALYDVYCTAALLIKMMKDTGKSGAELLALQDEPLLVKDFTFGKYRGKTVEEVAKIDSGYLRWMLGNMTELSDDMRYTLNHYLGN